MRADRSSRWHTALASTSAIALVLGLSLSAPGAASAPAADEPVGVAVSPASVDELTLVTGDTVTVEQFPDGRQAVTVDAAPRAEGVEVSFQVVEHDDQVYVVPSDAAPLVPAVLDRELFNVARLVEYGYTDGTPVIVSYHDGDAVGRLAAPAGMEISTTLTTVGAVAATIAPDGRWWQATAEESHARGVPGSLAGVQRIWLDGLVEAALDESVPQIGAPAAWDAGFDGTGMTVAVLDTGIDSNHPDLAGKVVAEADFTEPDDPGPRRVAGAAADDPTGDAFGHGTHVAGIIAGAGAASDGTYVGVAPGAELLNGKVLNDSGSGQTSWIIAGMEWAAEQGADVVNMSLGGGATDGTDPLSLAVNQFSAEHDLLFVIAAGNRGPGDHSVTTPATADAALAVGSVDKAERLADSSGRGPRRGDFAVKPDVTAPGVDIVSARSGDGTMPPPAEPVDEHYIRAPGTSMAAPHVAAAAAILLQQRPERSAADLKAILASTAVPNDDLDVYQQGGGRIDLSAAVDTPVQAAPAPVDLGFFEYPHEDAEPVSVEVDYTNIGAEPLTLTLSLQMASREGHVADEAMVSVTPDTVSLDPDESASVTVTVDVTHGEAGLYGGYLVAEAENVALTRTPVGFYKEPERYDLTIQGIDRDGQPAAGLSEVTISNADSMSAFFQSTLSFEDGVRTVRVPPGTYSVLGLVITAGARVFVGNPEFEVTGDTTLVLDAREASPITIDTPAHEAAAGSVYMAFWRQAADGSRFSNTYLGSGPGQYAMATDLVTRGGFEFLTRWRLGPRHVPLTVVEPVAQELEARFMTGSPLVPGGEALLPVVDAGLGRPADYDGVDASGALAQVQRGGELSAAELAVNAAEAGAVALVVTNNEPGGFTETVGADATIPTLAASMEDGAALRDLLAQGEVTVRLFGHPTGSSFRYDLVLPHPGQVPTDLHFVADVDELATVVNGFHAGVDDHRMGEARHYFRPWTIASAQLVEPVFAPLERTEYLVPGDTHYQQQLSAAQLVTEVRSVGAIQEPVTTYHPGEHRDQTWFRSPVRPGLQDGGVTSRTGNTLAVRLQEFVDAHGHWGRRDTRDDIDQTEFRLYQDGELVATAARPNGSFALSPDPAEYRLELDVARDADWWLTSTQTHTAWTIQSARPEGGGTEIVPLLLVGYDTDLDLLNTTPHPRDRNGPATLDLQVRHQPGADGPPIAGARAWVSYDDGDTWQPRPTRSLGDGRYEVILDSRDPADTTGYVTLRVEAWDTDGNRIDQQVTRAWRISPR